MVVVFAYLCVLTTMGTVKCLFKSYIVALYWVNSVHGAMKQVAIEM